MDITEQSSDQIPLSLETVAPEILGNIYGFLNPRDARSLSACNKYFYRNALPHIYKSIVIDVSIPTFIHDYFTPLVEFLQKKACLHMVKKFSILGFEVKMNIDGIGRVLGTMAISSDDELEARQGCCESLDTIYDRVADFLMTLPNLKHIHLGTSGTIPPAILQSVYRHHSKCNIELQGIRPAWLDNVELELKTLFNLPNLRSLGLNLHTTYSQEQSQVVLIRTLKHALSHVPDLQHIAISGADDDWFTPRHLWYQKLLDITANQETSTYKLVRVQSLALEQTHLHPTGHHRTSPVMQSLNKIVDTTCLRILKLCGLSGRNLLVASTEYSFPNLVELEQRLKPVPGDTMTRYDYLGFVEEFSSSLPPLSTFGIIRMTLESQLPGILWHHGAKLTSLTVYLRREVVPSLQRYYTIPANILRSIAEHCPLLSYFEGEVRREFSRQAEKEIYQAFSRFRNLQNVKLYIDCFVDREDRSSIRQEVRNSAFDETLALSIWQFMSNDKRGKPLEQILLYPDSAYYLGRTYDHLQHIYSWLPRICRSYELVRILEADWSDAVRVREIAHPGNPYRDNIVARVMLEDMLDEDISELEEETVMDLWGVSVHVQGWEQHCTSIPFR